MTNGSLLENPYFTYLPPLLIYSQTKRQKVQCSLLDPAKDTSRVTTASKYSQVGSASVAPTSTRGIQVVPPGVILTDAQVSCDLLGGLALDAATQTGVGEEKAIMSASEDDGDNYADDGSEYLPSKDSRNNSDDDEDRADRHPFHTDDW